MSPYSSVYITMYFQYYRAGGYDESLFKRLSKSQPSALTCLTKQYRMNRYITIYYDTHTF